MPCASPAWIAARSTARVWGSIPGRVRGFPIAVAIERALGDALSGRRAKVDSSAAVFDVPLPAWLSDDRGGRVFEGV